MKAEYIFNDGYGYICKDTRMLFSKQAKYLIKHMDGKTSIEALKRKFFKKYGLTLDTRVIYRLRDELKNANLLVDKKNGYLMSKYSPPFRRAQLKRFERSSTRMPTYRGLCYKYDPKDLKKDLVRYFDSVKNHKLAAFSKRAGRPKGIIVPHSNIELSGPCAAWAYQALAYGPKPDLFIILAPNHTATLEYPFSVLVKEFRMPMGRVLTQRDFAKMLAKKCHFDIFTDSAAHLKEYAVEIQLPFLQYLYVRPRVISMLCAEEPHSKVLKSRFNAQRDHFLQALQATVVESGRHIVFVATIDLLHTRKWKAGPKFHQKNKKIIRCLKHLNIQRLKYSLDRGELPVCGEQVLYALSKLLGSARGKVLHYSWTSNSKFVGRNNTKLQFADMINIGYASLVFY